MADIIVGISDMAYSDSTNDVLITHSLGSCLGISFYDSKLKIGGLLHCMLPLSKTDKQRAQKNPEMFVDTGVMALLQKLISLVYIFQDNSIYLTINI